MHKYLCVACFLFLSAYSCESVNLKRWSEAEENAHIVSFVLLNYNRLLIEINNDGGEYLDSLINAMPTNLSKEQKLKKLKKLATIHKNAYIFANSIIKE